MTVTIEAVEGTDNRDPSYVAIDDIIFISDTTCSAEPPGSMINEPSTTDKNCFDHCKDGSGKVTENKSL